jgi:hypothetical protein
MVVLDAWNTISRKLLWFFLLYSSCLLKSNVIQQSISFKALILINYYYYYYYYYYICYPLLPPRHTMYDGFYCCESSIQVGKPILQEFFSAFQKEAQIILNLISSHLLIDLTFRRGTDPTHELQN